MNTTRTETPTYNAAVHMPQHLITPIRNQRRLELHYTRHADKARLTDRYGVVPRLTALALHRLPLHCFVEVTPAIHKVVIRVPHPQHATQDRPLDVVLVIDYLSGSVITTWMNESTDNHATLNTRKVAQK